MIDHNKHVATISVMLAEIRFNRDRHNKRNWQKSKRDKLALIYEEEIASLEYALGVLTQKICFAGRRG